MHKKIKESCKGGHIFQVGKVFFAKSSNSMRGRGGLPKNLAKRRENRFFEKFFKDLIKTNGVLESSFIILKQIYELF